jgi:hypothetical protein
LLAELRRLRELQLEQADALAGADLDRLTELDRERRVVQARLAPADQPALSPADLAEARALAALLERDQLELTQRAVAARDALGRRIGGLATGRAALAGYRPAPAGRSLLLDRSR